MRVCFGFMILQIGILISSSLKAQSASGIERSPEALAIIERTVNAIWRIWRPVNLLSSNNCENTTKVPLMRQLVRDAGRPHRTNARVSWVLALIPLMCSVIQVLHGQDTNAASVTKRDLISTAINLMRDRTSLTAPKTVTIKATISSASAPSVPLGNLEATFEGAKHQVVRSLSKTEPVSSTSQSSGTGSKTNAGGADRLAVMLHKMPYSRGYATSRLDRHPGYLPMFEPWAFTDRIVQHASEMPESTAIDGVACWRIVLDVQEKELAMPTVYTVFIRKDSGDLRAVEFKENVGRVAPINLKVQMIYDDFAIMSRLRIPTTITRRLNGMSEAIYHITSVQVTK